MRVLHLTPEYPPVIWGGLGTAVGGLATASARAGLSTGVLLVGGVLAVGGSYATAWQPATLARNSIDQPIIDSEGVMFFHVSPFDAIRAGVELVRRWKPDVLHLHTAWLWSVARAIQEQTGTPLVFTVHSLDRAEYEIGKLYTHWQEQEDVISSANRVIALSLSEEELIAQACPRARGRIRIVGNGIDDVPVPRRDGRGRGEYLRVLYTGRFVERKGIRELLAAIPKVLDEEPSIHFVLVGGYGGSAEIERTWLAGALESYRSQVHFTGWLPPSQVAEWYQMADILVVPSWYEPFGMVILEGMIYGLPIAAAAVGGPAEILEHGRTALLFSPKDAEALARAVLQLVKSQELREQLGRAAACEVRARWLWCQVVERMREVYEEAAEEGDGSR
ncbi:glycosyltransferase family 4 protein [Archangium lipolyticum]|uniref:glycosyltransferase family 4 protein n=1 Tax=Archangium lipolyticum TaxID=2970465 RepID=UPI00214A4318|nr:glycosyltransferase family 4 protein [Archangium lipolyticum]